VRDGRRKSSRRPLALRRASRISHDSAHDRGSHAAGSAVFEDLRFRDWFLADAQGQAASVHVPAMASVARCRGRRGCKQACENAWQAIGSYRC
jgi:hypothetical protein